MSHRFLQVDMDDLLARIAEYEGNEAEVKKGTHDTTTNNSESYHDNPAFDLAVQDQRLWKHERDKLVGIHHESEVVPLPVSAETVEIGTVVTVRWSDGDQEDFGIGSYMVLNRDSGRISYETPMAQALLGAKQGEIRKMNGASITVVGIRVMVP